MGWQQLVWKVSDETEITTYQPTHPPTLTPAKIKMTVRKEDDERCRRSFSFTDPHPSPQQPRTSNGYGVLLQQLNPSRGPWANSGSSSKQITHSSSSGDRSSRVRRSTTKRVQQKFDETKKAAGKKKTVEVSPTAKRKQKLKVSRVCFFRIRRDTLRRESSHCNFYDI